MIITPKKSTTVILLNEMRTGFKVFLLKRNEKSSFMGGNFVYPGGIVDPQDGERDIYARCKGLTPEAADRILGSSSAPGESLSHWVAAIRELFEEAGVLLAYDEKGDAFLSSQESLMRYRKGLQEGTVSILRMAVEEKLFLAADQLHYYAHWITPEAFPQRFDTRFFLARHPAGQEASPDERETTRGIWLSPREAIEENSNGEVVLSPPTLKTMEDLSHFDSLDSLHRYLEKRTIHPVLPVLKKVSGESFIVYPWDPEYDLYRRGEIPSPLEHGRPSRPGEMSTRVLFRDGRWHLYLRGGKPAHEGTCTP